MKADTGFVNGRIWTGEVSRPWASSAAVKFGRFVAVDDAEAASSAAQVVDLGGRTVVPGFYDAHHHLANRGDRLLALDLSTEACPTKDRLLELVAEKAASLPQGGWVHGGGFDQNKIGSYPTRLELDIAAEGRPVLLGHHSGHVAVVNTAALASVGITDLQNPPKIPGGDFGYDEAGYINGVLLESAKTWFEGQLKPRPVEEVVSCLEAASERALSEGITSITDPGVGAVEGIGMGKGDLHAYMTAREQGRLKIRVTVMPYITATHSIGGLEPGVEGWGIDLGLRTGFGDDFLRLGAIKVLTDGALTGRTAALKCHYHDEESDGILIFDPEELRKTVVELHRSGWQVGIHAIGDRAVELAVGHIEEAQKNFPRADPRHRIEHCGMASDETLGRIKDLGIVPVPQGYFVTDLGDAYLAAVGPDRADMVYRMKSFLDAGVVLPGSSDTPVVEGAPMKGIYAMVNRLTLSGQRIGPREALTVEEAISAYTHGSAYASHQEADRGTITEGKLADMAVLDADPFTIDPLELADVAVTATVVGGEVSFGANNLA